MKRECLSMTLIALGWLSLVTLVESDSENIWSEVGEQHRRRSENRWSEWSEWKDTCEADGKLRRRVHCINDEKSCDHFEQVQSCNQAFKTARLAYCHFLILSSQADVLKNQTRHGRGERLKECESKSNCVGIYRDGNDGQWRTLVRPLPLGRRLYEEQCNTKSLKTVNQIILHQSRFNEFFSCNANTFTKQGLSELNNRYSLHSNVVTRPQALAGCEQNGGKLVEIESREELAQVQEMLTTNQWCHTGAQRDGAASTNRNQWFWRYSRLPANQDWLWSPGQPDASGDVGQMFPRLLDDWISSQGNIFICECQNPIVEYLE